ncbi:hypothetical protein [Amycolatopsis sp. CA-128772]|uniref:hypothetical protein n=1 Tax=Amycolatopsis sp. CA-128772 TaxID=2073159 RepID=UPI0011B034F0|nr:hypothetical protein [Amycolatopsis sp. CA-128772]
MSEDLVTRAQRERPRNYADLEFCADRALTRYLRGGAPDGQAFAGDPAVVGLYEQLTAAGAGAEDAAEVAVQAAAACAMRMQAGAPEQAEAVQAAVGALAGQVAAGLDTAAAKAEFREAIVGWRGDGYAEGPLAAPVMVAFEDGTVLPDGVEVAGVRETGPRHRLVVPQVQAGIDAYLAARADGVEHLPALELAGDAPGVEEAVGQFADDIEFHEMDLTAARDAAVASATADAAIGQFLSLRNFGMDIDQAAATAAGGDAVAIHAVAGFIAGVRDGVAEDVAAVDAWTGAVAAVRQDEVDLPGFDAAHEQARAALDGHVTGAETATADGLAATAVRRYESLTRLGMDPAAAARLAATDAAVRDAKVREHNEFRVLHEAETVIAELQAQLRSPADENDEDDEHAEDRTDVESKLANWGEVKGQSQLFTDEAGAKVVNDAQDGEPPPAVTLGDAVAGSGRAVDAAEAALPRTAAAEDATDEDTARAEIYARWSSDDRATETADDDTEGWQEQ